MLEPASMIDSTYQSLQNQRGRAVTRSVKGVKELKRQGASEGKKQRNCIIPTPRIKASLTVGACRHGCNKMNASQLQKNTDTGILNENIDLKLQYRSIHLLH